MTEFTDDDMAEMVLRLVHKIRNPLATIKTSVQLVEHLAQPQGDIADYLGSVAVEVGRIDQMLREMQAFVRLTPGVRTSFSVSALVRESVRSYSKKARDRSISIQAGLEAEWIADRQLLEVALFEVLRNADCHSPTGEAIVVNWTVDSDRLVLNIVDRGPGIADHLEERVLRPFYSTSVEGSGLGLNIASKAMALTRGTLQWQNLENSGCQFSLVVPHLPLPVSEIAS